MTSGNFATFPISSILIDRESRQRRTLDGIDELAASIAAVGLINPPVITRDGTLIAGERRLSAVQRLGWLECPVQFADEMSAADLHLLELEENVKRQDLSWQDHNDAIARYHELRSAEEGWTVRQTAQALAMDPSHVSHHLQVATLRTEEPQLLENAETFSTARNIAFRRNERKRASGMADMMASAPIIRDPDAAPESEPEPEARRIAIECANFLEWQPPRLFNLIHCDFPYGIGAGDKRGQSGAKNRGTYDDSPEIYWTLLNHFVATQDQFIHSSAHLIFWFSMRYYGETVGILEGAGWRVDPFPLIWHKSDNTGIIPDAQRGPRRTYETALFASRGDRRIVKAVANSYSGPVTKDFHTSEKSYAMLEHFMRMVVDDTSYVLDPTAGSGMAIRAAEALGCAQALGLELNPEFAEEARRNCRL